MLKFQSSLRAGIAAFAVALCACFSVAPAYAQAHVSLPSASLSDSLNALSKAAGVEILADPALLKGKTAPAVRGAATPEDALSQLLHGSGLRYEKRGEAFLILKDGSAKETTSSTAGTAADIPVQHSVATSEPNRAEAPTEEVVVTGSHIARPELESTMPISVIHADDAKSYGRDTIYDALLQSPAIGPGLGEMNSLGQEYDQGVANINLRNMGTNRSLVLVDGERWVSSGARTSAVDLNTIPTALIDRYEVVTGGAAAIYGADAVTGAVNIIMKNKMSGVDVSATSGISSRGDGNQDNISIAGGLPFAAGRGQLLLGGDFTRTAPISDLSRYPDRVAYYPNPAYTGPSSGVPANLLYTNVGQLNRSAVPAFCEPAGNCKQWYQLIDGVVTPVPQSSYTTLLTGEVGVQNGGPGGKALEKLLLRPESEKGSFYSHVSYELTPAVTWSGTFSYGRSADQATPEWPQVRDDERPTNWWGGTTGEIATLTNPYLPASLRQFMVANNLTSIPLDRTYLNLPTAYEYDDRQNITVGSNLDGQLADKLQWSSFVRYGQVTDHITTTNMVGRNEWLNARNTITDPATGQIECADPTARAAGCQPLNFFSTAPYSQSLLNYIEKDRHEYNRNTLLTTGANITDSLFSLPAGDASVVAGFEWRRETLETRDDPDTAQLADIVYSPGEDYSRHPALNAARETTELYNEAVIPVLRDLPLIERLEIEGAYRFSHYSDEPNTNTWKGGGTWEVVSGFSLRGNYSHSVRVPNFGELYSPASTTTYGNIADPCQSLYINQNVNYAANCAAILRGQGLSTPAPTPNLNAPVVYGGGNSRLTPETSNSFTYGVVLQPRFIPGFDMTVDYWDIAIDDVITQLSYLNILDNCFDSMGSPNQFYCKLITRDTQGNVASIQAQYQNLASEHSRGIDIGANYRRPIGSDLLRASFSGSYTAEQSIVAAQGQPAIDYAGEWDYPRVRSSLITEYTHGMFTLGVNTRYISRSRYDAAVSPQIYQDPYIPSYIYNDLTLTIRPKANYSISLGVKNISDARMPLQLQDNAISPHAAGSYFTPGASAASGAGDYDAIGRYFFLKFGAHF